MSAQDNLKAFQCYLANHESVTLDRSQSERGPTRRQFLSWAIGSIGAFIAAALGVPLLGYVASPALKTQEKPWADVGATDQFKAGEPARVHYLKEHKDGWIETSSLGSAWVVRQADSSFVVFNPKCTHLGCPYSWEADARQFLCPCHTGIFDITGKVISGPPPRPLDRFQHKVENGRLFVREEAPRVG
ncbi:MAG: ubiquinol-cytochrome c reductase iron-sulfur subunit [Chloroflexota bacterium]